MSCNLYDRRPFKNNLLTDCYFTKFNYKILRKMNKNAQKVVILHQILTLRTIIVINN